MEGERPSVMMSIQGYREWIRTIACLLTAVVLGFAVMCWLDWLYGETPGSAFDFLAPWLFANDPPTNP